LVKFSWSPVRSWLLLIVTVAPVKVVLPASLTMRPGSITVGALPSVQNTVLPPPPRTGAVEETLAVLVAVACAVPGASSLRVTLNVSVPGAA
jgi:hypothetical protein